MAQLKIDQQQQSTRIQTNQQANLVSKAKRMKHIENNQIGNKGKHIQAQKGKRDGVIKEKQQKLQQENGQINCKQSADLQLHMEYQVYQTGYNQVQNFNNLQSDYRDQQQGHQNQGQIKFNELSQQEEGINKKQGAQSQINKTNSKSNELLICIQDSDIIPTVYLEPSPKGKKYISIKIPMYRTTSFMKMQTQIFVLDIRKPGVNDYQVERRYSDFVEFYNALFYNHPGYILAPFPDKGIDTFLKIKLGIGTNQTGQRSEMIQRRMLQLQKFINYVTHHSQLSNSQQLANFITLNNQVYEQGKVRLQKYVKQNKFMEKGSQIKNLIGFGKSFISSYFKSQQKANILNQPVMMIGKNDIQFGIILQTVKSQKKKLLQQQNNFIALQKSQQSFSQFVDLPTENDLLLKLCSKHTSAKQFCKKFVNFIEIKILDQYSYNIKIFEEIQKSLQYRLQIWESFQEAKKNGNIQKKQKLFRRLQLFQRNFLTDWENIFVQTQKNIKKIHQQFSNEWKNHKKNMKRIWKHPKNN